MVKNRIKDFRTAAGMTQKELAQRIGVSEISVSDYERGRRFPRMTPLFRLTELLGCTVEDLFPRDGR